MGSHKRVHEALQLEHPPDLGALLDDREQLVEVLGHPPLHREHRHAGRRNPPRSRVKLRQSARELRDLATPELTGNARAWPPA